MPMSLMEKRELDWRMDESARRYEELVRKGEPKFSALRITAIEVGVAEGTVRRYLRKRKEGRL